MTKIVDLTATLGPETPSWPGTGAPQREPVSRLEDGDAAAVSRWVLGAHAGTHMDAEAHFKAGGWSMEALDLGRTVGPCHVADLTHVRGHVGAEDLEAAGLGAGHERVLLKTRNSVERLMGTSAFTEDYVGISRDGAEYLISAGVKTVGIDYLSVEPFEDAQFRTHHALMDAGVVILEGLVLTDVEPGDHFLVCLPLKLEGSDGSPMRAVLLSGWQGEASGDAVR